MGAVQYCCADAAETEGREVLNFWIVIVKKVYNSNDFSEIYCFNTSKDRLLIDKFEYLAP